MVLCKNLSPEKSLNNKCEQVSLFFHVTRLLHHSARLMNELGSLHHSQSVNNYFVYIIKNKYLVTFGYEISLLVFNSTPHSWDIELNTRREISYLRAHMYFSRRNFLRIPFTTDLMMTIFFCLCYLSPFKLLDILSEQLDMDICHICDYNWSGKFLFRFIHIGDYDMAWNL